jgi:hypothetical protein
MDSASHYCADAAGADEKRMTKDRKTLTDADIVSRRKGTPAKQGGASDADAPHAASASDSDAAGHKAPSKASHDTGDKARSDDRGKGGDKGKGHD